MADLDDFFAKKDRKKKTTKKFASTAEELAKQIEENSAKKNESKTIVRRENDAGISAGPAADAATAIEIAAAAAADGVEQPSVVEDEWKEFKAEERKDYSGLKIGQLQIADGDDEHTDGDAAYEKYDSDGEAISDADRQNNHGPWSRQADAENAAKAAAAAEAAAAAAPEPVAAAAAVDKNRSYVLPAMRMGDPAHSLRAKLRKGVLPDIHDQEYFPELGAAKPEVVKKKRPEPGFEEVRHGGRLNRPSEIASHAPVSIGNRFNSLADS